MDKFNIPKRVYWDEHKEMFSIRMPKKLLGALTKIAEEKGWNMSDIVITALDQYAQWEQKSKSAEKRLKR